MSQRISDELQGIDLGDKRLNDRSMKVIERLAADPQASINGACHGWNETEAAYRLFDNVKVEPEAILKPHREATVRRMQQHPVVLVVQDTTELDYTDHPQQDAGCLEKEDRFGLYQHTHLAVTPEGLCLGVVGVEQFSRTPESLGKTRQRKTLPIEQKESFRWLTGYRLASQLVEECPNTQVISIADCEADIYDIFVEAEHSPCPVDYVIRAKEPRCTLEKDPQTGPYAYRKVRDQVPAGPLRLTRTIDLPRTSKRDARAAHLEIRAQQIVVKPPQARMSLGPVTINVVLVQEIDGPGDGTDVEWMLLTTLPIDSVEEIEHVVDCYVGRWTIEVFFRVLKTGCRVEEIQLETTDRLQRCLVFYLIIAWRVMYLTYLNRECPSLPVDAVFADYEWMSVWKVVTGDDPPAEPPPLGEFMPHLAQLGGYNNRRTERPPGPQPVWIGIRRMIDFATAWLSFGPKRPKTKQTYV